MQKSLNLFDYTEYRPYLLVWLEYAKETKSVNRTQLAEVAGVHPTFLSHVLTGGKDLSLEQAALISKFIEHTQLERDYFFNLINFERAGNQELKAYYKNKKKTIELEKNKLNQRFDKHHELTDLQKSIFYSSWVYVAAWGSCSIDDGQSLDQIADRFRVSRDRAEEIMSFLVQIGVCDVKKGIYVIGQAHVHISNESPLVVKHHTNWRHKGIQKMDFREANELFFTSPMTMSVKSFEIIREKLNVFVKEAVQIATSSEAEETVCLNIDFFKPMTK